MHKDDFMWFSVRKREPARSHKARTRCCPADCGVPREHKTGTCIVTMQCDDEEQSCVVYQAEYPPQGNWNSVIETTIMASHVREEDVCSYKVGGHRKAFDSPKGQALEKLAAVWRSCGGQDWLVRQAVSWADVKANIVVKPGAAPSASDPWVTHGTLLVLMECDRAQRSFFRTAEFDSFGEKQFGPPINGVELVWFGEPNPGSHTGRWIKNGWMKWWRRQTQASDGMEKGPRFWAR